MSQDFENRRRSFDVNGASPLAGSASELAAAQLRRAQALAVTMSNAYRDTATSNDNLLETLQSLTISDVWDLQAHLLAEVEFYRRCADDEQEERRAARPVAA